MIFENLQDLKNAIHNDLFLTFCTDFEKLYENIEFLNEISKVNLKNINIFDVNKLIDDFINDTKLYVIEFDLYKNEILELVCIYINNQTSNIILYFRFFYFTKYEFVLKNTIDKRHEELEKIEINLKNFLFVKDDRNDFLIISKYLKEKLDDIYVTFGEFLDNYILAKKLKQYITSKIKSLDLENKFKSSNTGFLEQTAIHIIENKIKINEYINIENVHYNLLYEQLKSSIVYFNYILKKVGNNETFEDEINLQVKLLKKFIYCKWKYLISNKTLIKFIETSETIYFKILKFVFYRKKIISKQFESLIDAKCCYNFKNIKLSINIDGKDYKIEKNYIVSKIVKKIIHQPINGIKLFKSKHVVELINSKFHFTPNLEHILDFFNIFFDEKKDFVYEKNIAILFEKIIDEYEILSKISYLNIDKNIFEFNLNINKFSMTKIKHETINIIKIINQMIRYIDAINIITKNDFKCFIFEIQFDDKDFFKCIKNSIYQIEQYFAFFEIFLKNNMMPELNFFYYYLKIQKFFKKI
ncbi:hypothetical protein GVAV_000092 [Gurleya vavrai]